MLPGGMKVLAITMDAAHVLFMRADVAATAPNTRRSAAHPVTSAAVRGPACRVGGIAGHGPASLRALRDVAYEER
jgi:hypothetical protein